MPDAASGRRHRFERPLSPAQQQVLDLLGADLAPLPTGAPAPGPRPCSRRRRDVAPTA